MYERREGEAECDLALVYNIFLFFLNEATIRPFLKNFSIVLKHQICTFELE